MKKPPPLVSLCVIFRNNADTIQNLLRSVHGHFDEMVFVDTGSTDGTRKAIETYLRGNPHSTGEVIDFEWCDDFAKAREVSFKAASGKWRMFLDTDDTLIDGDNVRRTCQVLGQRRPEVVGCLVHYDYDFDEAIPTLRLVRDYENWAWRDAIHERLEWVGEEKPSFVMAQDFAVKHKPKTPEEKRAALVRNAAIARREYAQTDDRLYKGRLARTIAMVETEKEVLLPLLKEVVETHPTMAEGRKAAADVMGLTVVDDPDEAMRYARIAGPSYEAFVHYMNKDWPRVISRANVGLVHPPQTTHEGFIYERAVTPAILAEAVMETAPDGLPTSRTASSAERVINLIRPDLRHHKLVAGSIGSIRRDINRITIVCPSTPQPFYSNSPYEGMLGGSEEAVVFLSHGLARQGRNVRIYTPLPAHILPHFDDHGVEWCDFKTFNDKDEHGHLVTWRSGQFLVQVLESVLRSQQGWEKDKAGKVKPITGIAGGSFWLHDMSTGGDPTTMLNAMRACDSVVVLSDHHKKKILEGLPEDPGNIIKIGNGVNLMDFEWLGGGRRPTDPNSVVYSSCPSRGLPHLLAMWPRVRAACPEARLDIYYDWSGVRSAWPDYYRTLCAGVDALKDQGVVHHGGVDHKTLHTALTRANVWAYSHFDNPDVETFCISAVKATVAGSTVLTVPNGALPEVAPDAIFCTDHDEYCARLIEQIQNPASVYTRTALRLKAVDRWSWDAVAARFSEVWTVVREKSES